MPLFGRRLMQLRCRRNLRQEDLAKDLHVSRATVSYYEAKAKNPTTEFVQKVADYFGVSIDELLLNEPDNKLRPGPKSKIEKKIEAIHKLPPEEQKAVFTLIDSLAGKQTVLAK